VFQLSANVFFDMKSGYLLVQNTNTSLDVYNGVVNATGEPVKVFTGVTTAMASGVTPDSRSGTSTTPFLVMDTAGGNMVLYKYLGDSAHRTLVVVFSLDTSSAGGNASTNLLKIRYVGRFNPSSNTGVDIDPAAVGQGTGGTGGTGGTSPSPVPSVPSVPSHVPSVPYPGTGQGTGTVGQGTLDEVINAYYLNNFGIGTGTQGGTTAGALANNYMLKSQIIPPVCPTCPSYNPTCSTCTGTGTGTGTSKDTEKAKDGDKKDGDKKDASGNHIRSDINQGASDVYGGVKTVGKDVKGAVGDVYGGVKEVGKDVKGAVGDAYGEVKELGGEVKGAVGDVFGGVKGAVGDVYGGIKGAIGDVYGGVKGVGGDVYGGAKRLGSHVYGGAKRLGSHVKDEYNENRINNSRGTPGNMGGDLQGNMGYAGNGSSSSGVRYITAGASPMTYYGAVPERGQSDFLPVTADFSRFGR
jgi:hypothetical protein